MSATRYLTNVSTKSECVLALAVEAGLAGGQATNPKLTIFFFAFLRQFVSSGDPHGVLTMVGLSAVFMLITFVIFAIYGVFAARVIEQVITRPRVLAWMRRVFAGSFIALSAKLAFTSQVSRGLAPSSLTPRLDGPPRRREPRVVSLATKQ